MKILIRHIETLLLEHDCVIVEGLGGFIANQIPAAYNAETESFRPPYRNVTFNQQLTENDGLLTQRYMQTFDAAYPEALRQQEKDISQLCTALDMNGEVQVGSIGLLQKDLAGKIRLTPEPAGLASPALYGLSEFSIKTLAAIEAEAKARIIEMQPAITSEPNADSTAGRPQDNDRPDSTTENKKLPEKFPLLIDFSIAAAVAAILFLLFTAPAMQSPRVEEDSCLAGTLIVSPAAAPRQASQTAAKQQPTTTKATAAAAPAESAEPTATQATTQAEPQPETTDTYTIVLASHVTKKNALIFIKHLADNGLNEAEFVEGKTKRVVYGKFPTEEAAARQLKQLRQTNKEFESAWTMKLKPTKA